MKRLKYYFLLPLSMLLLIVSCTKSSDDSDEESGNWIKRSDFEGNARTEAVSFVIGDTAYIGTGFDGTNRYTDFWAYDAEKNFWVQRAQFLGKARNSAVGFTIGNKGYIATGYDGVNRLKDNWEYDPATNTWIQKADFGGTARYDAVGFGISTKGYITTGFDGGYTKDFWEFTPTGGPNNLGVWTQLISLGGTKRSGSVAWVHNNKAYIVGGINNGAAINEFWVYDPVATSWQELRKISNVSDESYDDDYSDILRYNAVGFVLNNKGYLSTGENGSYISKSWEYDFVNDLWTRKTSYERAERSGAIAFAVKSKAFIACGRNNSYYFDNLDEFQPNVTYNSND